MISIILAAIIFGLVHPGSKLILDTGIDLFSFCELYVLIRLIVQVPFVIRHRAWKISGTTQFKLLLGVGLVGALLQLMEFMGISKGLPVPVVTFLVYSHPVWSLLFSRFINKEPFTKESYLKLAVGVFGIALITGNQLSMVAAADFTKLLAPLSAGLLIALWVSLSNKLKKTKETSSWTISFYYDLFALVALLILSKLPSTSGNSITDTGAWLSTGWNFSKITFYSILVGLLPNLLFYQGSHKVPAFTSSLVLLLEPVVACIVATLIWHDHLSSGFYMGAALVLISAVPLKKSFFKDSFFKVSAVITIMLCLFFPIETNASTIHIVEIVPADQNEYIVSKELEQIKIAYKFALEDFKKLEPACITDVKEHIQIGSEEKLFNQIKEISNSEGIIVGLSRTTFARIGAKAAAKSELQGISIGAAFANISEINPKFTSIVSPLESQWAAISSEMKTSKCTGDNTIGVFDSEDLISKGFKKKYLGQFSKTVETEDVTDTALSQSQCIFMALNFSVGQKYFPNISNKKIQLFGIGDWNIYSDELKKTLRNKSRNSWHVTAPTGWLPQLNLKSQKFAEKMKAKIAITPSPIAAYAYDATLIAALANCKKIKIQNIAIADINTLPLLREYGSRTPNNFISKMNLVRFTGDEGQ